jgi:lysophospholipase L1-like esterase
MRLTVCTPVAVLCVSLGCSDGGGNPMGAGVPAPGSSFTYAALGASDVVGVGSSQPCSANFQDCNGNSYVFVAARQLRTLGYTVTVSPLGISGALIGKILDEELPLVPREARLVTIFTGGNDVKVIAVAVDNGLGGSDPNGYIDQRVATFKSDFATLVAGTRSRAPDAKIVVLNLTNIAALPIFGAAPVQLKQWTQRASVGVTNAINATSGITIVDLMCRTVLDAVGDHAADGFHPNDSGYTLMAGEVVKAFTSSSYPAPLNSCSRMTLF